MLGAVDGAADGNFPHRASDAATAALLPVARWRAWGLDAEAAAPDVAFIEPALRRRLSSIARSALAVAEAIRPLGTPVRVVFASRHGELTRNAEMLMNLADGELPSPMNFSLSVLNAVTGLYGIARRDNSATTAVSAGPATVPLALLEGAAQAWAYPAEHVLVVCADEPAPPLYADLVDEPVRPYALAVLMKADGATRPILCNCSLPTTPPSPGSAVDAFVDCLEHARPAHWTTQDQAWRWEPQVPAGG
jgi:hypothetical protein